MAKHNPNVNDHREHDFMLQVGALGRADAAGDASRPTLALQCVMAASEGYIVPDNAEAIWKKFQSERQSKVDPDLAWQIASSEGEQVSKLKAFLKMGVLAMGAHALDPVGTMDRACKILVEGARNGKKAGGSKFDTLLKVARVQQDKEHYDSDLSDDELIELLYPRKGEATEEKLVKAAIKAAERADKAFPSEAAARAVEVLAARHAAIIAFKEAEEMRMKGWTRVETSTEDTREGKPIDLHEGDDGFWSSVDRASEARAQLTHFADAAE